MPSFGFAQLPDERPNRDAVDVHDVLREVDCDRLLFRIVAVRAELHVARVEPHESVEGDLVAEARDDDIAVLRLRRRADGDYVAIAKARSIHAVPVHSQEVVVGIPPWPCSRYTAPRGAAVGSLRVRGNLVRFQKRTAACSISVFVGASSDSSRLASRPSVALCDRGLHPSGSASTPCVFRGDCTPARRIGTVHLRPGIVWLDELAASL